MYTFLCSAPMLVAIFYMWWKHGCLDWFFYASFARFHDYWLCAYTDAVPHLETVVHNRFPQTRGIDLFWSLQNELIPIPKHVWDWILTYKTKELVHDHTVYALEVLSPVSNAGVFTKKEEYLLWLVFSIAFFVKIPMIPFHTWLPEAHVEAPTPVSMILAGVLLKMGGYGYLHFCLIFFPNASREFSEVFVFICLLSVIYASICALCHIDLKKIVAYSSIAHMSFSMIGFAAVPTSPQALIGSTIMMISHGFVSMALFFSVGFLYERYGTRNITYYSNVSLLHPVFSPFLLFFCFANTGFPGTSSFVGEFLVLVSFAKFMPCCSIFLCIGIIFSTIYSVWLCTRVCYGSQFVINNSILDLVETRAIRRSLFRFFKFHAVKTYKQKPENRGFFYDVLLLLRYHWDTWFFDCKFREFFILLCLTILVIYIGLFPRHCFWYTESTAYFYSTIMDSKVYGYYWPIEYQNLAFLQPKHGAVWDMDNTIYHEFYREVPEPPPVKEQPVQPEKPTWHIRRLLYYFDELYEKEIEEFIKKHSLPPVDEGTK